MKNRPEKVFKYRALKMVQPGGRQIFLFSVEPSAIWEIAEVSRISKNGTEELLGYQRSAVRGHVNEIVEYLKNDELIFAHPLILALPSTVKFSASRGRNVSDQFSTSGDLEIPRSSENKKPCWIVDGQQRALAITRSQRNDFPVPICAFVADEIDIQRDQFIRINSSKPLPKGLIAELLPEIDFALPPRLAIKKLPSEICGVLDSNEASPFFRLVQRASTPKCDRNKRPIKDTVLIHMIEESLKNPAGCLYPYRDISTGECDSMAILSILCSYWNAVKSVFPEAWGKTPEQSRLMHSAGIRTMGRLMDRIMSNIDPESQDAEVLAKDALERIQAHCRWTSGSWEGLGGMDWNELQNVPKHVSQLSNFLIREFVQSSRSQ